MVEIDKGMIFHPNKILNGDKPNDHEIIMVFKDISGKETRSHIFKGEITKIDNKRVSFNRKSRDLTIKPEKVIFD